jgi:hypothetical protein
VLYSRIGALIAVKRAGVTEPIIGRQQPADLTRKPPAFQSRAFAFGKQPQIGVKFETRGSATESLNRLRVASGCFRILRYEPGALLQRVERILPVVGFRILGTVRALGLFLAALWALPAGVCIAIEAQRFVVDEEHGVGTTDRAGTHRAVTIALFFSNCDEEF